MKVILKQDVLNLGEEGDICEVARGYARNYLVPQGYAMLYNRSNMMRIEARRAAIEQRKEEKRKAALEISERLGEEELVFMMNAGDNGKLFGAVTAQMIVEELAKRDVVVERKKVDVPEGTIKVVGTYKVGVKLYGDKDAEVTVRVVAANASQASTGESASEAPSDTAAASEAPAADVASDQAPAADAPAAEPSASSQDEAQTSEPEEAQSAEQAGDTELTDDVAHGGGEEDEEKGFS